MTRPRCLAAGDRPLLPSVLGFVAALTASLLWAAEVPRVGEPVPDLSLSVLDGGIASLAERRTDGPVVLVFFRGVW